MNPEAPLFDKPMPYIQAENKEIVSELNKNISPETRQKSTELLGIMREFLGKPEASEWKEGKRRYSGNSTKENSKVPPSEKFFVLEDKKAKRSFIIRDAPVIKDSPNLIDTYPTQRYTTILVTDLPDKADELIKRKRAITVYYDDKGEITSVHGADSIRNEDDKSSVWRYKVGKDTTDIDQSTSTRIGFTDKNRDLAISYQELHQLMASIKDEIKNAAVNEEFAKQISERAKWKDEYSYAIFNLMHKLPGKEGEGVETWREIKAIKSREPMLPAMHEGVEKDKKLAELPEKSTPQLRSIIPMYILQDKDFTYVYTKLKEEITDFGKKHITDEAIDTYVKNVYELKKAELLKGRLKISDTSVEDIVADGKRRAA